MAKKDQKNKQKKNKGPFGGGPNPNSPQAREREFERLLQRSEKLWEQDDLAAALDILEDLMKRDPDDARPVVLSGVLYAEMGDVAEALYFLRLADRMEPDDPRVLDVLAAVLMLNNRPAQSLETMRRFRNVDRKGEFFTVESQKQLTTIEEALRDLAKGINVSFHNLEQAQLLIEQSYDALAAKNTEQSIKLLEQAHKLTPKWADPSLNLAKLFFTTGEADKALEILRQILDDVDPNSFSALSRLLTLLSWREQIDEAVALLPRLNDIYVKEAASPIQTRTDALLTAGSVLYSMTASCFGMNGDHQRAYEIMQQGEQAGVEYGNEEWTVAGVAAYNSGKVEEAEKYWQEIEEQEQSGFLSGLMAAVLRPRPVDAPPLQLPYINPAIFVPVEIMGKMIDMKDFPELEETDEPSFEFDQGAMKANYEKLNPLYNIYRSFEQNINFGMRFNAETQVGLMSNINAPEVVEALKQYARGYTGPESARRYAVAVLIESGDLPTEGTIRFWLEDAAEWRDLQLATDFAGQIDFETQMLNDMLTIGGNHDMEAV